MSGHFFGLVVVVVVVVVVVDAADQCFFSFNEKKRLFFTVRHTIELSICPVVIRGFAILFVFVYKFVVFVAFVVYLREPLQSNIPNLQTSLSSTIELKR